MNRRGFALLAVLWTLTAMTLLTGATMAVARLGSTTSRNRLLLARAAWAREACGEILQARYAQDASVRRLDSVDLGRNTWCTATLEDPSAKLNLNLAAGPALASVLEAVEPPGAPIDSLVDAALDWRDSDRVVRPFGDEPPWARNGAFSDVSELRYVRGFNDEVVARLSTYLTTRGTGAININAAPPEVLATVPGLRSEAVQLVLMRRAIEPIKSADALAGLLSSVSRASLLSSYPEFVQTAVFSPPQLIAYVGGGVGGTPIAARVTLTLVPAQGRLAVIRRETE